MKIILISITVFFLLNCSTQSDRNSEFIVKNHETFADYNSKEDSGANSNTINIIQDKCADRKDTIVSPEIDSLLKSKFPRYRLARNSDFFPGYWCYFYSENQSPYFVTGDFDGDDETETVLMINKDERYSTLIILIDKIDGQLQAITIEELKIRTDIDIELKYTKYGYGLKTKDPFEFKPINSDTTYNIRTDIIVLEGFEEKADYFYYYRGGEYQELMLGS